MAPDHILLLAHCLPGFAPRKEIVLAHHQLYAVEPWLLQRRPCACLLVYTADPAHSVVLIPQVPASDGVWQSTLAQLAADGARQKQTAQGTLIVTSLAHFRSDYTIVPIPDGNFRHVRTQLYANIDLLRTAATRRTALTLQPPTDSTRARFLDAYRLPAVDDGAFVATVLELVKLVQASLALFGLSVCQDGLLCDPTVQAIRTWTSTIGAPCLGLEPTERILDPLFVSAILSLVLSIRNKLAYLGHTAHLPRDPFLHPHALTQALASYLQATAPSPPAPPSHHRTFSSPYHAAIHTSTPLIPPAPPLSNILAASAASAAAAAHPPFPAAPILTRQIIESISTAYSTKLKAENRKVRRVIKNRLAATPSPLPHAIDSDGPGPGSSPPEDSTRRHTLSLTLSLSGGEGSGALSSSERNAPPPLPLDNAQSQALSLNSSIGASGGQLLSGIGSSLASGLRLGTGGGADAGMALGEVMAPTLDLASFTAFSGGKKGGKKGGRKAREREKERHAEAAGENPENPPLPGTATPGSVYPNYGYGGYSFDRARDSEREKEKEKEKDRDKDKDREKERDKERDKDKDTLIAGSLKALWSGRVAELVRAREEVEDALSSTANTTTGTAGTAPTTSTATSHPYSNTYSQPYLSPSSSTTTTIGLGPAPHPTTRRHKHRASDSLSVLGELDKWRRDKSPLPKHAHPASDGDMDVDVDGHMYVDAEREGEGEGDGDGDDGSSWTGRFARRGRSKPRPNRKHAQQQQRDDGRSTEEESDVFGGRSFPGAGVGAGTGIGTGIATGTGGGSTPSFGGMWSGRVRGKLGTWAGLAKRKNQSQSQSRGHGSSLDLGSGTASPLHLPSPSTRTSTSPHPHPHGGDQKSQQVLPTPPKLIITQNTGSTIGSNAGTGSINTGSMNNRRPPTSRRSTLPPELHLTASSGPQSPTLPPMVFSHDGAEDDDDDDDLLSSGQISPLSDYRPNPFNMLGSTSNLTFNTNTNTTRTGLTPEEYERTVSKLLSQKRPWTDRRVPQTARVASWADPMSASSVRSDEEGDGEDGEGGEVEEDDEDGEEEEEEEEEEEMDEEEMDEEMLEDGEEVASVVSGMAYTTGTEQPPPVKRKHGEYRSLSVSPSREKQLQGTGSGRDKLKPKTKESEPDESDVSRLGGAKSKGKGKGRAREKTRFHSLLSVLDGEGVLAEEPLEESEYDDGYDRYGPYGGLDDYDEFSEDGGFEREDGRRRRKAVGFDPRRRRSCHDLDTFRGVVEVLSPERMKIDVDLCGHILIMARREEHLRNVITCTRLITQSLSKTNMALREHYETHLPTLDLLSKSTSVLSTLDTEHQRSLKILQSTNTLEYESAQFLVDELWQSASPSRRKVFALRDKVFNGAGGRRLPAGVRGAHGAFNRLQWKLDGGSRVVDDLGRTESEAEEERRFDELSTGVSQAGHVQMFMDAPAEPIEEGEGEKKVLNLKAKEEEVVDVGVVEHPGIKPVWLLRFFTSWGARWNAATATAAANTATSPPATGAQSPATEKEGSTEPEPQLRVPETIRSLSLKSEPALMSTDDKRTEANLPRPASH